MDFVNAYFVSPAMFTKGEINLQGIYKINDYEPSFLNYYNCVLNYYHFREQTVGSICQESFHVEKDSFIENFADVINKVETYSK